MSSTYQVICFFANSVNIMSAGNLETRVDTTCGPKPCEKQGKTLYNVIKEEINRIC